MDLLKQVKDRYETMQDPRHSGLGSGGPTVVAGGFDGVGLGFGLLGC